MNKDEILHLVIEYRELKTKDPKSKRILEIEGYLVDYVVNHNDVEILNLDRLFFSIEKDGSLTFRIPSLVSQDQKELFVKIHLVKNPSWFLNFVLYLEYLYRTIFPIKD